MNTTAAGTNIATFSRITVVVMVRHYPKGAVGHHDKRIAG
jgi:hypothetical protein